MYFNTAVIVLKQQKWRDYDLLLDLFSQQKGTIKAIAFGANSAKSVRGRHCQIFNYLTVGCQINKNQQSNNQLYQITEVDELSVQSLIEPKTQKEKILLACAYYVGELMLSLGEQIENHEQGIKNLKNALQQINNNSNPANQIHLQQTLRYFEMQLLALIGYDLQHFTNQKSKNYAVNHSLQFYYSLKNGWTESSNSSNVPAISNKLCQKLYHIGNWQLTELNQLKKHNRWLIQQLTNHSITKSRNLVKNLTKN